jgi:glycogen operon protein
MLRQHSRQQRRGNFGAASPIGTLTTQDLAWFRPDGQEMQLDDWGTPWVRSLIAYIFDGEPPSAERGNSTTTSSPLLILFNAWEGDVRFTIPETRVTSWRTVIDTFEPLSSAEPPRYLAGDSLVLQARSTVVLEAPLSE